ncbi:MAG TPA: response regulator [Polyangia bacterium]
MGRILLADENDDNRLGVARAIEKLTTLEVDGVGDGLSALERLRGGRYDLVLLEVLLPGLDGVEVCRRLRDDPLTRQLPVLFLTGAQHSTEKRLQALEVGADDFIVQPVVDRELVARIRASLRVKAFADEIRRHNVDLESSVRERTRIAEQLTDQLRAERDTLRETFDVFDEALLLIGGPGQLLVANAAGRRLNQTAFRSGIDALAADAVASGAVCDRALNNGERSFVGRAYPVSGGRVLLYVRDVTEERGQEIRRLQAEKLASIGTLAAGVAHEINNPAAFVLGNLEALVGNVRMMADQVGAIPDPGLRGKLNDALFEVTGILQETKEGMARIHRIVKDLSWFSHVDDERGATTELNATVESTLSLLKNELRHRATVERELKATRTVTTSPARLGQVFLNLIMNAAQALDVARTADNRIRVRTFDDGEDVIFEVSDNGVGILPEVLPRIFDSFFTTKPRGVGTGLGLPITHGIVRSLGGEITVDTQVNVGTTFRVRMPSRPAVRIEAIEAAATPTYGRRRVLAIDDEPLLLKAYRRMLGDVHEVVTALGGRDALLVLQKQTDFDAILCDLQMPEMSGMELYAKVEARYPEILERFIFSTGGAFSTEARRFLDRGVTCIGKPFRAEELLALIETKIAERSREAADGGEEASDDTGTDEARRPPRGGDAPGADPLGTRHAVADHR